MGGTYYNEIDPAAAAILRELIASNVIAPGDVDTRSIKEVQADDLRGYAQCHFFAGGGLWSVAARLAGWPDDEPLWTGSCPCQPFSVAGKGGGTDDPRHLWPDFFRLIGAARPPVVMGEQVAGKAGRDWFHGVRADLAGGAYGARAVDIPACAVDAPHIRQRLYWIAVADAEHAEWRPQNDIRGGGDAKKAKGRVQGATEFGECNNPSGVTQGDAIGSRLEGQRRDGDGEAGWADADRPVAPADGGDVADSAGAGREQAPHDRVCREAQGQRAWDGEPERSYGVHSRNGSWWAGADWIQCHDQKARRTKPGLPLLVDGLPGRVGLWRVAGNAISPIVAAQVIAAYRDTLPHAA